MHMLLSHFPLYVDFIAQSVQDGDHSDDCNPFHKWIFAFLFLLVNSPTPLVSFHLLYNMDILAILYM